jgi:hypothetical protein
MRDRGVLTAILVGSSKNIRVRVRRHFVGDVSPAFVGPAIERVAEAL